MADIEERVDALEEKAEHIGGMAVHAVEEEVEDGVDVARAELLRAWPLEAAEKR